MSRFFGSLSTYALLGIVIFVMVKQYEASHPATFPDQLIEQVDTDDGPIIIYEHQGTIRMTFNPENWTLVESAYDPRQPDYLAFPYARYLSAALMYTDTPKRITMIGMGGGTLTSYLHRHLPNADISAVEISPEVVELAKRYFDFTPDTHYRAVLADGLDYLKQRTKPYDIIILDAYADGVIPAHLATVAFYQEVSSALSEGGVVSQNIETTQTDETVIVQRMQEAFDHVDVYPLRHNVVAIAYNGEVQDEDMLQARANRYTLPHNLNDMLRVRRSADSFGITAQPAHQP